MKQFSLEEYLKNTSRKVVTRDGRPVRIICTDAKRADPILGLIEEEGIERIYSYMPDGTWDKVMNGKNDLFFHTERNDGFVNIYRSEIGEVYNCGIYKTKEEALDEVERLSERYKYIDTIKITWEE